MSQIPYTSPSRMTINKINLIILSLTDVQPKVRLKTLQEIHGLDLTKANRRDLAWVIQQLKNFSSKEREPIIQKLYIDVFNVLNKALSVAPPEKIINPDQQIVLVSSDDLEDDETPATVDSSRAGPAPSRQSSFPSETIGDDYFEFELDDCEILESPQSSGGGQDSQLSTQALGPTPSPTPTTPTKGKDAFSMMKQAGSVVVPNPKKRSPTSEAKSPRKQKAPKLDEFVPVDPKGFTENRRLNLAKQLQAPTYNGPVSLLSTVHSTPNQQQTSPFAPTRPSTSLLTPVLPAYTNGAGAPPRFGSSTPSKVTGYSNDYSAPVAYQPLSKQPTPSFGTRKASDMFPSVPPVNPPRTMPASFQTKTPPYSKPIRPAMSSSLMGGRQAAVATPRALSITENDLDPSLSSEQKKVVMMAANADSFFFTGAAGTGKSYVLKEIIRVMKEEYTGENEVVVVAPTGMAAIALGGCTIHSWAGIGLGNDLPERLIDRVRRNQNAFRRWQAIRVMIIDEVSMLSADLFDLLHKIGSTLRGTKHGPFGGFQVILCGDFFQLPPVIRDMKHNRMFCFESVIWKELIKQPVNLTQVFRQASDTGFVQMLNELRLGAPSHETVSKLKACINRKWPPGSLEPTRLYPLKNEVATFNNSRLSQLQKQHGAELMISIAKDIYKDGDQRKKQLDDACPAPYELPLVKGALVVLLKNKLDHGLVNGSRGIVIGFHIDGPDANPIKLPRVEFENGVTLVIDKESWTLHMGDQVTDQREQIPLNLAWALSIHKAQGMTISQIEVSLKNVFECGQAYVALSRVSSLDGLSIREEFDHAKTIKTHEKVVNFYQSLRTIN